MPDRFRELAPRVADNEQLRVPQREGYLRLEEHYTDPTRAQETAIILPVGCGKSGLITLIPFAVRSRRTLVVAPYVKIAEQLYDYFDPTRPENFFYGKYGVLVRGAFPEPVEIRGRTTNRADLDEADVVVTNIDQLQGPDNRWLTDLPGDYFDLILFDEGHHAVAESWEVLRRTFPEAKIVNLSATPRRADGQLMPGELVYTFPVRDAINHGYVKRLKALMLNPETLRFVSDEHGREVEVPLEEVIRLGEEDAAFRRGIVTSRESLATIVGASIRELRRIRRESGDDRHKIIASALHFGHCAQVVEAFRAHGLRADYVHSRRDAPTNERVLQRLERHELDVIVQVRKLGEGFDHPHLSVAAVCSIFSSLSPFVQFVGRIMRVVDPTTPDAPSNQGTVVFHAGANVAQRWDDFREFSGADQEYFDQLLPLEGWDFSTSDELEVVPDGPRRGDALEVRGQTRVLVEEIPLLEDDEARAAIQFLRESGYTMDQIRRAYELEPLPTTRVRERQAARLRLDQEIRHAAGELLGRRRLLNEGRELDTNRLGRTNFVVVKAAIDRLVRSEVADKDRSEFTRDELDRSLEILRDIVMRVEREVLGG